MELEYFVIKDEEISFKSLNSLENVYFASYTVLCESFKRIFISKVYWKSLEQSLILVSNHTRGRDYGFRLKDRGKF